MSASLFGRRAATALVCVLGLGVAAPVTAALPASALDVGSAPAAPAGRMQDLDPADFTTAAAELPAGLVDAVRRDLDLSPEQYLAAAAAARQAGQVVAALGDVVRSAWLEGRTLHVAVADRADAAAVEATGAEVHVGDPLADALAAARAQNKLAYIDRAAERVVPVEATVEGEPVGQLGLFARDGEHEHRGGSGFAVSDLLSDYYCSTGFTGTNADGDPLLLTAGHCGGSTEGLFTSPVQELTPPTPLASDPAGDWPALIGPEIGAYVPDSFVFGDGRDAGLIELTKDDDVLAPEVAAWSPASATEAEPLRVYDSIDAIAGAPACSAGVTSGWSCGRVLDAQTTVPVSGQQVTGFVLDTCVLPGDSGGAVVVGNYALGINSGSTWQGPTCADGETNVSLGYAVSGGTENAEALYGEDWELLIHVGTPVITSPADHGVVGATPTLTGTVRAAAGATVTVTVDDGPTLRSTVGPTGRWSATADEPLEPGTYEYEVTVSHRTATGDTVTESAPVEGTFEVAEQAGLSVGWPSSGQVAGTGQPTFEGTGEPGATVTLAVGDDVHGTATVQDDGTWSLTPDDSLAAGRFDAVLSQEAGDASTSVTVADIGVTPGPPVITSPRAGDEIGPQHTFTGVGVVGATVSLRVTTDGDRDPSAAASSAVSARTDEEGVWEIRLDGPLAPGQQVVIATQTVDDVASQPSRSVAFEVTRAQARTGGDLGGDTDEGDLAETGWSSHLLLFGAVLLLAAGAFVAGWRRGLLR
ncbi:Ig-like domain-containing protein [Jiangella asiatica]|uniref:Bacterial Ig-like domain-containing protein n=1 Tax=Jiangella asiatica TaxID=2530372 RepID=A0A4R5DN77_9ACTN|nr:Ig-like domain-containing protein [Jiangella asiatica]TDE14997.1 hypothetical protein E1269_02490 [Jiangella asiatica]